MNDKKILVVGNSYSFVKRILEYTNNVVVAPGNPYVREIAECVDIREDSVEELFEYAVKNDIDLTVVVSDKAVRADISAMFLANNKAVFCPSAPSAEFVMNKSVGKRFLYKLRAPISKFAIFEKQQLALDYLSDAQYPLIISSDKYNSDKYFCTTIERAKFHVEDLFISGETKIVLEDYVHGKDFTLYFISDGYHALPLVSVRNFKFSENGDGGIFTSGVGAYVPYDKISKECIDDILNNVILKALNSLQNSGKPYCGIIGVNAVLTGENEYKILNFVPFISDVDIQAVLNSVDENILELLDACANGFFADEYDDLLINDNISVSCVLKPKNNNLDKIDFSSLLSDYCISNNNLILTANAKTLSRAKKKLAEDIDNIGISGFKVRSDIYNS